MAAVGSAAGRASTPERIAFGCKLACLCIVAMLSAGAASTGFLMNAYVYAARSWLPERSLYHRPLFFEYANGNAHAQASFIKWQMSPEGYMLAPGSTAFLKPGQKVDVIVDLVLPETEPNSALFMMNTTLHADDGAPLASMRRPVLLRQRSALVQRLRELSLFPLILLGLVSESQKVRFTEVEAYVEKAAAPLTSIAVALQPVTADARPPAVYSAQVTVAVRIGWIQWVLSLWRPGVLLTVLVFLVASSMTAFFSALACGAVLLAMYTVTAFTLRRNAAEPLPAEFAHSEAAALTHGVKADADEGVREAAGSEAGCADEGSAVAPPDVAARPSVDGPGRLSPSSSGTALQAGESEWQRAAALRRRVHAAQQYGLGGGIWGRSGSTSARQSGAAGAVSSDAASDGVAHASSQNEIQTAEDT